jgi:hypothetical protein
LGWEAAVRYSNRDREKIYASAITNTEVALEYFGRLYREGDAWDEVVVALLEEAISSMRRGREKWREGVSQ